ncbi:MAG: hypothetical protein PHY15_04905 [Eubacteriales bacterium]|nr:hypothetical protein [Eubacteriales bacterium]MDD4474219.1 hypothetical protein [Eubacteriales bacterium]
MAIPYIDLDSKFPKELDNFEDFIDPDVSTLPLLSQYEEAVGSGDLSAAANILNANPILKRMIVSAGNLNKIKDAIVAVQRFYFEEVEDNLKNIFENRGVWVSSIQYKRWDMVSYNGLTYLAFNDTTPVGTLPTNAAHFRPISIKGDKGDKGDPGLNLVYRGVWNLEVSYAAKDVVTWQNSLYVADVDNAHVAPHDSPDWTLMLSLKQEVTFTDYTALDGGQAICYVDLTSSHAFIKRKFFYNGTYDIRITALPSGCNRTLVIMGDSTLGSGAVTLPAGKKYKGVQVIIPSAVEAYSSYEFNVSADGLEAYITKN